MQKADESDWKRLAVSKFGFDTDSPGALLLYLDTDFGSATKKEDMHLDNVFVGQWGTVRLVTFLLVPFLDKYSTDDNNYNIFYQILTTFCNNLSQKIDSYKKSVRSKSLSLPPSIALQVLPYF